MKSDITKVLSLHKQQRLFHGLFTIVFL